MGIFEDHTRLCGNGECLGHNGVRLIMRDIEMKVRSFRPCPVCRVLPVKWMCDTCQQARAKALGEPIKAEPVVEKPAATTPKPQTTRHQQRIESARKALSRTKGTG